MLPSSSKITPEPSSNKKPKASPGTVVPTTTRWMFVWFVSCAPVPVTVMVYLPVGTEAATVISATLVPVSGLGAKEILTPAGAPVNVSVAVGESRSRVRLMLTLLVPPASIITMGGTDCRENSTQPMDMASQRNGTSHSF